MSDKVLDVRHVVDSMVSPEGLQAGGGEPVDAYTKEESDALFCPKATFAQFAEDVNVQFQNCMPKTGGTFTGSVTFASNTFQRGQILIDELQINKDDIDIRSQDIKGSVVPSDDKYGAQISFTDRGGDLTIGSIKPMQHKTTGITELKISATGALKLSGSQVLINDKDPFQEQIITADLLNPNTSQTAYVPGVNAFNFNKVNAKYNVGGKSFQVFKFYATLNYPAHTQAGNTSEGYYFNLPSGYQLPTMNNLDDQLYLAELNNTVQYNQAGSGGRGFATTGAQSFYGPAGDWHAADVLVATHAANPSDVATKTQIKIVLGRKTTLNSEPFDCNVSFAIALEETE